MRKVQCYIYEEVKSVEECPPWGERERKKSCIGMFLAWHGSEAIVELEDGFVKLFSYQAIQFLDRQ